MSEKEEEFSVHDKYVIAAVKYHFSCLFDGKTFPKETDKQWLDFYNSEDPGSYNPLPWGPFNGYSLETLLGFAGNMADNFYSLGKQYGLDQD